MRKRQCELTVRLTGEELRSLDEKVKRTIFTREAFCRRVLAGKTNKEISDKLYISDNTVKFHVRNLLRKTGCSRRKELLALHESIRNE